MRSAPGRLSPAPALSILVALFVSSLASPASAVTGDVLTYVKHGHTATYPLANIDEFGGTAAGLGDLDGTGPAKYAVAVGAALDDNGISGSDRGAIYIVFLD